MAVLNETDLYAPVKQLLEEQGYTVRAEVDRCDLVAVRGGEPPVIVELKRRFALSLVYQGIERQRITGGLSGRCRADRPEGVGDMEPQARSRAAALPTARARADDRECS